MLFHSPRKKPSPINNPKLHQTVIELVHEYKYLGIVLDPTLSWVNHIANIENKVSVLCGIIRKVKAFVSQAALLKYYYACIHSMMQYLNIVWGNACKSKLARLQVLQNRCLKHIFSLPRLYPTVRLYENRNHSILPIRGLCELQTCIFVHDIINNENVHNNLPITLNNNVHNTRQAYHLIRTRAKTNLGQKRITFIGPQKYNLLPNDLKPINNRNIFKIKLKLHLKRKINEFL